MCAYVAALDLYTVYAACIPEMLYKRLQTLELLYMHYYTTYNVVQVFQYDSL